MKVLIINGSPRPQGNTALALDEAARTLNELGVETETILVGNRDIRGCVACRMCHERGECVFRDIVNETAAKLAECDGMIVGSPVYYASPNGTLLAFLDRLFFSTQGMDKRMKVGASVVVCRRGGASASFDALNKYFTISGMPVVSSQYWNSVHGREAGEAMQDAEGLQTMRTLARNMAFLMRAIADAKARSGLPEEEKRISTHFIR
ncbi:MAG: flavodoxin family protein [Pyramidobacter sp.]|nr:flavodoxin family protein [Pyramidobacter sp.]